MEMEESENRRIRCELSRWNVRVTKLVKVVTDQFELRKCYSKKRGFGHTKEVPGVEEEEVENSPDDDAEVISSLHDSTSP